MVHNREGGRDAEVKIALAVFPARALSNGAWDAPRKEPTPEQIEALVHQGRREASEDDALLLKGSWRSRAGQFASQMLWNALNKSLALVFDRFDTADPSSRNCRPKNHAAVDLKRLRIKIGIRQLIAPCL